MQEQKSEILGIDTSNYKTSLALVDQGGAILWDLRELLSVKKGELGLRQSEAFFQHVSCLPKLLSQALEEDCRNRIGAVAYSNKPRPRKDSYMPVFKAGESIALSVAAALGVPAYAFSHQEGHIEAIKNYSNIKDETRFLCFHLSGGTCDLLQVSKEGIQRIGGTRDISLGQLIDRIGVIMGFSFPAGEEMDYQALEAEKASKLLKPIHLDGLFINLSGLETQCSKLLKEARQQELVRELFDKMTDALIKLTRQAANETGLNRVLFTGGVAASAYISKGIRQHFCEDAIQVSFGKQEFSQDNAVGIALLGGKHLWRKSR